MQEKESQRRLEENSRKSIVMMIQTLLRHGSSCDEAVSETAQVYGMEKEDVLEIWENRD